MTRYHDVSFIVRHPELFSSETLKRDAAPTTPPIDDEDLPCKQFITDFESHQFVLCDPPDHSRMRSVLTRNFGAKCLEDEWRETVRSVIAKLLDGVAERGEMNL